MRYIFSSTAIICSTAMILAGTIGTPHGTTEQRALIAGGVIFGLLGYAHSLIDIK